MILAQVILIPQLIIYTLCQEKPEYYYLDATDNIFKPYYESCSSCNGEWKS